MAHTDDGQAADDHEGEREYWLYLFMLGGYCRVVGEDDNWTMAHQMTGETGRLFAAAAELLAALKKAVEVMRDNGIDESMAGEFDTFTDAIRKAEGGE